MQDFRLSTFVPQRLHFPYEVKEVKNRIAKKSGIPTTDYVPAPNIRLQFEDGPAKQLQHYEVAAAYIPGDAVRRIHESDDVFSMFMHIVDESVQNLKDHTYNDLIRETQKAVESLEEQRLLQGYNPDPKQVAPQDWLEWQMSSSIAAILRGTVDPEQVFTEEVVNGGELMTPHDGRNEIIVEKPCNNPDGRLARDIVKFEIENCQNFFENAWEPSLIIRRLIRSEIEPSTVESTVEFSGDVRPYGGEISVNIGI